MVAKDGSNSKTDSDNGELAELDWIPAQRVQLRPGISVRVRRDAFTGELATIHNGRIGDIVTISGGDVVIQSTDNREPQLLGAHYSPWVLEMKLDDCLSEGKTR